MPIEIEDFWPKNLGATVGTPPVLILREQAALLGQKTQNVIQAEVKSRVRFDELEHTFYLVAPALQFYQYRLFVILHPAELYPIQASSLPGTRFDDGKFDSSFDNLTINLQDEGDFVAYLKEAFGSEKTQKVIQALIAQSRT